MPEQGQQDGFPSPIPTACTLSAARGPRLHLQLQEVSAPIAELSLETGEVWYLQQHPICLLTIQSAHLQHGLLLLAKST